MEVSNKRKAERQRPNVAIADLVRNVEVIGERVGDTEGCNPRSNGDHSTNIPDMCP